jgi:hypothetical protein
LKASKSGGAAGSIKELLDDVVCFGSFCFVWTTKKRRGFQTRPQRVSKLVDWLATLLSPFFLLSHAARDELETTWTAASGDLLPPHSQIYALL